MRKTIKKRATPKKATIPASTSVGMEKDMGYAASIARGIDPYEFTQAPIDTIDTGIPGLSPLPSTQWSSMVPCLVMMICLFSMLAAVEGILYQKLEARLSIEERIEEGLDRLSASRAVASEERITQQEQRIDKLEKTVKQLR